MTATLITCTDCGAPLTRSFDRLIACCDGCQSRWTALAVIGAPSRIDLKDAARDASFGADVEDELSQVGPEPSDLLPAPADWINIARSGDIPPHDGRRCPECGYPLTEAHDDGHRPGWLLCPCCDTYDTGEAVS